MKTEIIVAGAGPAGLIAALSLAKQKFSVVLAGPSLGEHDRRTTALMAPALEALHDLGLGDEIVAISEPLETMRIMDATSRLVRSPTVTFRASEIGEPYFGLNLENARLNAALEAAVRAEPNIRWTPELIKAWSHDADHVTATLADGETVQARLAVAADGRGSPARDAAGITLNRRALNQSALVASFRHTRSHGRISNEFHTQNGPFTQVPLSGMRSSLVWVMRPDDAQAAMALDDEALSRRIEDGMQSMLGEVTVEAGRQVYPLSASTPRQFAANRFALVGEAAHVFPPIGAQGLNLGIRDAQDLAAIVAENRDDPGGAETMRAYDAKRRPDILARSGAVNLLNQSLLSDFLPAQIVRSAGLGVLQAFGPLRTIFMREGLRPGSGLRGIASDLRKQVRR